MNVADLHCDTILKLYEAQKKGQAMPFDQNDLQLNLAMMQRQNYLVQNFALFIDKKHVGDPYQTALEMVACYQETIANHPTLIRSATSAAELRENRAAGYLSSVLTMEEGAPLAGKIERVQEFFDLGVRMLTLTWNYPNEIGYPNAPATRGYSEQVNTTQGLTPVGIEIVREMNRVGMIVDVSHGSDALVYDLLRETNQPFVASHSNARALCPHYRNLSDDLIHKIADRGGLIGLNFSTTFLHPTKQTDVVESLVAHASYLTNLAGFDVLGLGSDFDGIKPSPEFPNADALPLLEKGLRQAGFTTTQIEKIFYQNVWRFYQENL